MKERITYVRDDTDLAGIGFWALHYDGDDVSFWDMIHDETTWSETPGTTTGPGTTTPPGTTGTTTPGTTPGATDWVADAGLPFLAYVGDTVVLSGAGSRGPTGATLRYRWTQVAGEAVELTDPAQVEPAFAVASPGTREFSLEVGDGSAWSAPASSWVVVIDPALAERRGRCGCRTGGATGGLAALALLLPFARSRRRLR